MTEEQAEKEFEEWFAPLRIKTLMYQDVRHWCKKSWLEKGKRDREKVTEAINDVLSYDLPHLAKKRLRRLGIDFRT